MAVARRTIFLIDGETLRDVECSIEPGGVWVVRHADKNETWAFYPMWRIELVVSSR